MYRARLRVVFFQSISVGSEWEKKPRDLENPGSHDTAGNAISFSDTVDVRGTPPSGRKSKSVFTVGNAILYGGVIRTYLRYVIFCTRINTILTLSVVGEGIRPITFQ